MSESFLKNVAEIKKKFSLSSDKYAVLIDFGRSLCQLDQSQRKDDLLVSGCQSKMFLLTSMKDGKIYFQAASDALISSGLVSILIMAYSGESPDTILKTPPHFLDELGIGASLSPSRANGLYQIHLRMKQDTLKLLVLSLKNSN